MLEVIFTLITIFTAYRLGVMRATNMDVTRHNEHMQQLIDEAYEKRNIMKRELRDAEERAETWKRRDLSLVPEDKESNIGS